MELGTPDLPPVAEFSRIWLRREVRFAEGGAAGKEEEEAEKRVAGEEEAEKRAEGIEVEAEMAAGFDEEEFGVKIVGEGTTAAAEWEAETRPDKGRRGGGEVTALVAGVKGGCMTAAPAIIRGKDGVEADTGVKFVTGVKLEAGVKFDAGVISADGAVKKDLKLEGAADDPSNGDTGVEFCIPGLVISMDPPAATPLPLKEAPLAPVAMAKDAPNTSNEEGIGSNAGDG